MCTVCLEVINKQYERARARARGAGRLCKTLRRCAAGLKSASIPSVLINEEMSRSIFVRQHARLFLSTHTWQLLLFRMCTVAKLAASVALATQLVQRIGFRNVYAPIVTSLSGRTDIQVQTILLQTKSDAWLQSMWNTSRVAYVNGCAPFSNRGRENWLGVHV